MPKSKYDKVTVLYVKMGNYKDRTKKYKKDKKKSRNQEKECSSSSEETTRRKMDNSSSEEEYVHKRYPHKKKHSFKDDKQSFSSSDDRVKSKRNKAKSKKKRSDSSSSSDEWVEKTVNDASSSKSNKKYSHKRKHDSENNTRISSSKKDLGKKRKIDYSAKSEKRPKKEYSSSSEEWVEKNVTDTSSSEEGSSSSDSGENRSIEDRSRKETCENNSRDKREDWMNLQTTFLTSSNSNKRLEREKARKLEREKQQYNPRQCSRELNPYWKDGGDGLPKFKKPHLDDDYESQSKNESSSKSFNWRKKDNKEKLYASDINKQTETNLEKTNNESFSEKELNILAAKLVKAEIMGNIKLINELKEKLEMARNSQKNFKSNDMQEEQILLTHTDAHGKTQPLKLQSDYEEPSTSHKRKKKIETHVEGQRVRYFADDEKYSLKQMFEKEKYNSAEDQNSEFLKMVSKVHKNDDLDDIFSDNIRKIESDSKIDSKNREQAISEHQKVTKSLENCNKCIQSDIMLKHLMVSMRETCYLALPPFEPLTEGHCLIVPIRHVPCATQLDENEWSEILDMRRALIKLFKSKQQEVIFFETAVSFHRFPHMCIQCIPMPKEDGDVAPIYFKKAIDESETEWSHNKKLISLKGKDVRRAVPKGLPYFSVSFGIEEGFAHVIEDEQMFPNNFAQEIIGGMLDIHHSKWRKPKKQSFKEQSERVLEFSKEWKDFDET